MTLFKILFYLINFANVCKNCLLILAMFLVLIITNLSVNNSINFKFNIFLFIFVNVCMYVCIYIHIFAFKKFQKIKIEALIVKQRLNFLRKVLSADYVHLLNATQNIKCYGGEEGLFHVLRQ